MTKEQIANCARLLRELATSLETWDEEHCKDTSKICIDLNPTEATVAKVGALSVSIDRHVTVPHSVGYIKIGVEV